MTGITKPTASSTSAGPRNNDRCAHSRVAAGNCVVDGVQPAEHESDDQQADEHDGDRIQDVAQLTLPFPRSGT